MSFTWVLVPVTDQKAVVCPIIISVKEIREAHKHNNVDVLISEKVNMCKESLKYSILDWIEKG